MADTLKQTALELLDDYQMSEEWVRKEKGMGYSVHVLHDWVVAKRAEIERLSAEEDYRINQIYTRIVDFNGKCWYACGQVLTDEEYAVMRAKEKF